jgi:hypothetical protein
VGGVVLGLLLLVLAWLARRRRAGRSALAPDPATGLAETVRAAPPDPAPDRAPTVRAPPAAVGAGARPGPGGTGDPVTAGSPSPVGPSVPAPGPLDARDHTRLKRAPAPVPGTGQAPAYCWQCGSPVRAGARFCGGCGCPVG